MRYVLVVLLVAVFLAGVTLEELALHQRGASAYNGTTAGLRLQQMPGLQFEN